MSRLVSSGSRSLQTLSRKSNAFTSHASRYPVPDTTRSTVVVAVLIQDRSMQVGIAACFVDACRLELRQFADNHAYDRLLVTLSVLDPTEVIAPDGPTVSVLEQVLNSDRVTSTTSVSGGAIHGNSRRVVPVVKRLFSESTGLELIERFAADAVGARLIVSQPERSLALAACAAVLQYIEYQERLLFRQRAVQFVFTNCEDALFMDACTLNCLELLERGHLDSGAEVDLCVQRVLRFTHTTEGARALRRTILEPPTNRAIIDERLDAVEFLLSNDTIYYELREALRQMPSVERVLAQIFHLHPQAKESHLALDHSCVQDIRYHATRSFHRSTDVKFVRSAWQLRRALEGLVRIREALDGFPEEHSTHVQSQTLPTLLEWCRGVASLAALTDLHHELERSLVSQADLELGTPEQNRLNAAFAVRAGASALLDTARQSLSETVSSIHRLGESTKGQLQRPRLHIAYNAMRGYHFVLPLRDMVPPTLPRPEHGGLSLRYPVRSGKNLLFTTDALIRLNTQYQETLAEIWHQSSRELTKLTALATSAACAQAMHEFCDCLATLDVILALVTSIRRARDRGDIQWARPQFQESGSLAIKEGRHLLLSHLHEVQQREPPLPNDTYIDDAHNLILLFGANASGKSVYMKQTALIVLLAQMGCFVPAAFVSMPIFGVLLARSRADDALEHNLSSFALEMRETASALHYIDGDALSSASLKLQRQHRIHKLVLFDEVGRSTGSLDGKAIAWSVLEYLSDTDAHVIFATHFNELARVQTYLPNVRVMHLRSRLEHGRLCHDFKLVDGALESTQYGTEVAIQAGLPPGVIENALRYREIFGSGAGLGATGRDGNAGTLCLDDSSWTVCQWYSHANALYQRLILLNYSESSPESQCAGVRELAQQFAELLHSNRASQTQVVA
ncbi:MutS protein msh4 [Cyanidiococcus yangmingshanensis]|uniref:MutS protein msh4 n=1 Tax=Cyanidiococcus yangmingshanensis TaxID=2690220 RepID=A0A7J7IH41_9RHOD|nr:MutS protein msh4 [Cyanidiococcus yangmingshanensis]